MYFVYLLNCNGKHLYVGSCSDLNRRFVRHKNGQGAEFTKRNTAQKVVYFETFATLLDARRREKQIKGWRREKKDNLIKYGKPII